MANTFTDIRQAETRILQDQLNSVAVTQMDSTLASINNELTPPGRLIAQATPSLVVTIGSGTIVNPNTSKNRVLPFISGAPVSFSGGSITFPSTSGTITVSPGTNGSITIGASQYVAVLVQLSAIGDLSVAVGSPAGSLGAVVIPTGISSLLSLGYVIVQSNGSSVIQSVTNGMLYQFVGGGGSGGGSSSGLKNYLTTYTASSSSNTPNPGNGNFESGSTAGWSLANSTLSGVIPNSAGTAGSGFSSTNGGTAASSSLNFSTVSSGQLAGLYSGSLASVGGDTIEAQIPLASRNNQVQVYLTGGGPGYYVAQAFTLSGSIILSEAKVIFEGHGSPTGNISIQICNDSAGSPNLGSVVATSTNTVNSATVPGSFTTETFTFSSVPMSSGTYHLVVITDSTYQSSATNVNNIGVGDIVSGSSAPFAQGYNGSTWNTISANIVFEIHQILTGAVLGDLLISNAFFIDKEDQAKALGFSFAYEAESGVAGLDFSGTSANTFAVYIYDVTNAVWIQPAGVYNLVQSSGVGICNGTFQSTSNSIQYQIALITINSPSNAYDLYLDDFFVGPQISVNAPVMNDWTSYVPATVNLGIIASSNVAYRRIGDSIEVSGTLVVGTPTAGTAQISLPSGLSIDFTKFTAVTETLKVGDLIRETSSVTTIYNQNTTSTAFILTYQITFPNAVYISNQTETGRFDGAIASDVISAGDTVTFSFVVPISGWSSNALMSNDTDTRVVAMSANNPSSSIPSSANANITTFGATAVDTHGTFNASTGFYTIPVSGIYEISAQIYLTGTFLINNNCQVMVYQNNSAVASGITRSGGSENAVEASVSTLLECVAGDQINFVVQSDGTGSAFANGAQYNFININRLSGPAVIAASETVAMRYSDTSGASIGTGPTLYAFQTISYDTHGDYSNITGLYTVPVSGIYSIKSMITTTAVNLTTAQTALAYIYINGSLWSAGKIEHGTGSSSSLSLIVIDDVQCNAGDTIAIYASSNVATNAFTTPGYCYLSIAKTGKGS